MYLMISKSVNVWMCWKRPLSIQTVVDTQVLSDAIDCAWWMRIGEKAAALTCESWLSIALAAISPRCADTPRMEKGMGIQIAVNLSTIVPPKHLLTEDFVLCNLDIYGKMANAYLSTHRYTNDDTAWHFKIRRYVIGWREAYCNGFFSEFATCIARTRTVWHRV
jgi:hypothetical protein